MKKIISIIMMSSLFSGTVFLGFDASSEFEVSQSGYSFDRDFDKGAGVIGYIHPISWNGNMGFDIGIDYTAMPFHLEGGENCVDEYYRDHDNCDPYLEEDYEVLSIYLLPTFSLNQDLVAWFRLGVNKVMDAPYGMNEDMSVGMTYGIGADYKFGKNTILGLGYIVGTVEYKSIDEGYYEDEVDTYDISFTSFRFNIGYMLD